MFFVCSQFLEASIYIAVIGCAQTCIGIHVDPNHISLNASKSDRAPKGGSAVIPKGKLSQQQGAQLVRELRHIVRRVPLVDIELASLADHVEIELHVLVEVANRPCDSKTEATEPSVEIIVVVEVRRIGT